MEQSWHPIFWTDEPQPGLWVMKAPSEVEAFGRIEIRRVSGVVRYKVTLQGETIGWSNNAKTSTRGHRTGDASRRRR